MQSLEADDVERRRKPVIDGIGDYRVLSRRTRFRRWNEENTVPDWECEPNTTSRGLGGGASRSRGSGHEYPQLAQHKWHASCRETRGRVTWTRGPTARIERVEIKTAAGRCPTAGELSLESNAHYQNEDSE